MKNSFPLKVKADLFDETWKNLSEVIWWQRVVSSSSIVEFAFACRTRLLEVFLKSEFLLLVGKRHGTNLSGFAQKGTK